MFEEFSLKEAFCIYLRKESPVSGGFSKSEEKERIWCSTHTAAVMYVIYKWIKCTRRSLINETLKTASGCALIGEQSRGDHNSGFTPVTSLNVFLSEHTQSVLGLNEWIKQYDNHYSHKQCWKKKRKKKKKKKKGPPLKREQYDPHFSAARSRIEPFPQ